jgi:hypothetical protein
LEQFELARAKPRDAEHLLGLRQELTRSHCLTLHVASSVTLRARQLRDPLYK